MSAEATEASIDGAVDGGASVPLDQMTATFLTETLGASLKSAQDSVAEMVRRAQAMSEEKVAESRRVHADLQEEYERFRSWRAEIQPLLDANRGRAETVQADVEQTIGRLRDAMKPLTDEMSAVEQAMSDFLGATPPPIPPALDLGPSESPPAPVVDTPAAPPEAPSSSRSAFDTMWALPGSPEPATAEPAVSE